MPMGGNDHSTLWLGFRLLGDLRMEHGTEEEFVLHVAETTEASPKQIRDLLRKHHGDRKLAFEEAKKVKAES